MRVYHDRQRALRAFIEDDESTIAAIRALAGRLPEGAAVGGFGPEELAEVLESHPGADRAAVVDYFAFRPPSRESPIE